MKIGAHMSIGGGVEKSVSRGRDVGCEVVQLFTKSNRRWAASELEPRDQEALRNEQEQTGVEAVMVHMAYLINLASPKPEQFEKSYSAFVEEVERADFLNIPLICFHPGSHTGQGEEKALEQVADAVDRALDELQTSNVRVLIEGMAGQGTSIGYRFEQLHFLLNEIDRPDQVGICLDTAHLHAAGYDLSEKGYEETFRTFDDVVGLDQLYAFHLNDTEEEIGSHVDRHHHIGKGELGKFPFQRLVSDERFSDLPGVIETPKEEDWDQQNISLLKQLRKEADET